MPQDAANGTIMALRCLSFMCELKHSIFWSILGLISADMPLEQGPSRCKLADRQSAAASKCLATAPDSALLPPTVAPSSTKVEVDYHVIVSLL